MSAPRADRLLGEWRRPHNDLQDQNVGGGHKAIHDDKTAAEIGFGAAPIHGTVHWSQFTPLLLEAFGHRWFETGSISVHFVTPVSHLQPVRAWMEKPDPTKQAQQVAIGLEHVDGRVVLEGTASVGLARGEMRTMVQRRMAMSKPVKGALVFVRAAVGTRSTNVETARIDFGTQIGPLFPFTLERKLEIITEYHPWFAEATGSTSPWGKPVLPPEALNSILLGFCGTAQGASWPIEPGDEWLREAMGDRTPVGLFGGCEVIMHAGPVMPGVDYTVTRELVGKGETRGTEFSWTRSLLREAASGKLVAEMTLQHMSHKGSVEGYEELRRQSDAKAASAKL